MASTQKTTNHHDISNECIPSYQRIELPQENSTESSTSHQQTIDNFQNSQLSESDRNTHSTARKCEEGCICIFIDTPKTCQDVNLLAESPEILRDRAENSISLLKTPDKIPRHLSISPDNIKDPLLQTPEERIHSPLSCQKKYHHSPELLRKVLTKTTMDSNSLLKTPEKTSNSSQPQTPEELFRSPLNCTMECQHISIVEDPLHKSPQTPYIQQEAICTEAEDVFDDPNNDNDKKRLTPAKPANRRKRCEEIVKEQFSLSIKRISNVSKLQYKFPIPQRLFNTTEGTDKLLAEKRYNEKLCNMWKLIKETYGCSKITLSWFSVSVKKKVS